MTRYRTVRAVRAVTLATTLAVLSACATTPATALAVPPLSVGQEATIQGSVVQVDTAPWAYDGNAVVTVATARMGTVEVQLPARWNLCKAQPLPDLQALRPRDRVEAVGTVTAPDTLTVCAQPQHRLRKLD